MSPSENDGPPEYNTWLSQLAERDGGKRALAEPELAMKEALLKSAQTKLQETEASLHEIEKELEEAREEASELSSSG